MTCVECPRYWLGILYSFGRVTEENNHFNCLIADSNHSSPIQYWFNALVALECKITHLIETNVSEKQWYAKKSTYLRKIALLIVCRSRLQAGGPVIQLLLGGKRILTPSGILFGSKFSFGFTNSTICSDDSDDPWFFGLLGHLPRQFLISVNSQDWQTAFWLHIYFLHTHLDFYSTEMSKRVKSIFNPKT